MTINTSKIEVIFFDNEKYLKRLDNITAKYTSTLLKCKDNVKCLVVYFDENMQWRNIKNITQVDCKIFGQSYQKALNKCSSLPYFITAFRLGLVQHHFDLNKSIKK